MIGALWARRGAPLLRAGLEQAFPQAAAGRPGLRGLAVGLCGGGPRVQVQQHLVELVHPVATLLLGVRGEPAPGGQRRRHGSVRRGGGQRGPL